MHVGAEPENEPVDELHVRDCVTPYVPALHVYVHVSDDGCVRVASVGAAGGEHVEHTMALLLHAPSARKREVASVHARGRSHRRGGGTQLRWRYALAVLHVRLTLVP